MSGSLFAHPDRLLLVFGFFAAWLSVNVYRPLRPTVSVGVVSFFLGWLTGELAMHHVVVQVLALAYFIHDGALTTPLGYAGAALTIVSIALLVRFQESGHRLLGKSTDVFGAVGLPAPSAARIPARSMVRPFHMVRRQVVVERSVPVATVGDVTLHADVFHRSDKPANAPIVVYVHGGGWVIGYKQYQGLPILNQLAERGYVCVSASYRLSPRATFPDHAHDIYRAIAWAKANAARYGGDPSRVVVMGNSAGGHIAAVAALGDREPRLRPPELADADLSTIGAVCIYGVFDVHNRHGHWPGAGVRALMRDVVLKTTPEKDPDLYRLASPIDLVRRDSPPFLVIHGDHDSLVPVGESRRFVDALCQGSDARTVYLEVEGAQHAFDIFRSVRGAYAGNAIVTFLDSVTSEAAPGQAAGIEWENPECAAS